MHLFPAVCCVLLLPVLLIGCRSGASESPPYDPDAALATFAVEPGFRLEQIAAEPLITDPVAMEVDEAGRVYVVEMPGYPLDVSGTGRIKRLRDTDGDGRLDEAVLVADGLTMPTGLMRWKDGLLVTDPPNVLYLADTDGDDRADVREVVLTGFALSNPQHNVNKPLYGLDNWIYLANNGTISWTEAYADVFGDRGTAVHFPARPDGPRLGRNAHDRNVRFRPDTFELESLSGDSQFGHTFDAWGRHFLVDNSHHQVHEVLAARYLERAPDLPVRSTTHDTPDHGAAPAVYSITRNPQHQLLTDRGVVTSAAGLTYYLGGAFPTGYDHVTFVAEPVHNLVHADRVEPQGATFVARRLAEQREFLASTDSWFRPVNFYVGPDGALYLIDYYRQIVEHPEWMDEETVRSGQLQNGMDRGRIYRIVAEGADPMDWVDDVPLATASPADLVAALARPNTWWRRTAQRLLVDRQPAEAVPLLERMARSGGPATARLHALYTLDGLHALPDGLLLQALQDPEPGVRENAIRLAEARLDRPAFAEAVLALSDDPDPRVRFQLLCTLGDLDTPQARRVRHDLLLRDIEDDWVQVAALTSPDRLAPDLYAVTLAQVRDRETPGRQSYLRRVAALVAARGDAQAAQQILRAATGERSPASAWWRTASLEGVAEGLRHTDLPRGVLPGVQGELMHWALAGATSPERQACLAVLRVIGLPPEPERSGSIQEAVQVAARQEVAAARRVDALRLLALDDPTAHVDLLRGLIDPQEDAAVQAAALQALRSVDGPEVGAFLLERWPTLSPALRDAAVDVLMADEARIAGLLDAIEQGTIQPSAMGWRRTVRLMRDLDDPLRRRARALLSEKPGAREEMVQAYVAALEAGDAEHGRVVYERACATCHQVGGAGGRAFGPDLGTVRHWSPEALVAGILIPSRAIADGYELWSVEDTRGRTVTGIIADETSTSLTLRDAAGTETTMTRADIAAMTALAGSAMPAGLEAQLSHQDLADLIAFLRGW